MFKIIFDHTPAGKTLSAWCHVMRHKKGSRAGLVRRFDSIREAQDYISSQRRLDPLARRALIVPIEIDAERLDWDNSLWPLIHSEAI